MTREEQRQLKRQKEKERRRKEREAWEAARGPMDLPFLLLAMLLLAIGLIMLLSASFPSAQASRGSNYDPLYYFKRQSIFAAIGAAAMLWVFVVPPLLWRKLPLTAATLLDGLAIGLYVLLIAWEVDGLDWYLHLALPATVLLAVILLVQGLLFQRRQMSILSTLAVVIAAVAVFVMGLELLGDLYFHGAWGPSWSLVVLIVAVGLEIPLMVVRRVPGLRREARRRFHM